MSEAQQDSKAVPEITVSEGSWWTQEQEAEFKKIVKAQAKKSVEPFWQGKYEKDAVKNWDYFYKRNTVNFFRDRHYLDVEFKELAERKNDQVTFLEVGCGVGNAMFPLAEANPAWRVYGLDCSARAVGFVKANDKFDPERCAAWVCDITSEDLPACLVGGNKGSSSSSSSSSDSSSDSSSSDKRGGEGDGAVDLMTLIYVLSALHPDKIVDSLRRVGKGLAASGVLFIRDYAVYDMTMLRFKPGSRLADNLYVRQDGTRTYFFSVQVLTRMLEAAGFEVLSCAYHTKEVVNRKRGVTMHRSFVQARARVVPARSPGVGRVAVDKE